MVLTSYEPGTICWAKLKGYPWWPSRIEQEDSLSEEVVESKPRNSRVYPVLFFGSLDYAWITPDNLEPYEENVAKYGIKAKNRKDPSFSDALIQARDPSIAEEIIRRSLANIQTTSEDDDDEVKGNGRPTKPSKPVSKKKGKKRASLSGCLTDEEEEEGRSETTPKRSRTNNNGTSRRESLDSSRSRLGSPSSHPSPDGNMSPPQSANSTADKDAGISHKNERSGGSKSSSHKNIKNRDKNYQFLMQMRHRLQKTVIKGPVPDDLAPVNDAMRRLEEFDMTLELIQETKLGKVMRIIADSDKLGNLPEEQYDIKGRAVRLAKKWRSLISKRREGSTEPPAGGDGDVKSNGNAAE